MEEDDVAKWTIVLAVPVVPVVCASVMVVVLSVPT